MEKLRPALLLAALAALAWAAPARADKLVLKDGTVLFGTITDEKDSLIRYFDRFERPRKIASGRVDTIHYDSKLVNGLVKVAFRKGQPQDRSGFFRLRHSEELDLEVEYKTDSISELDLFFRSNVHVRVPPNSHFKVIKAPKSGKDAIQLELYQGTLLVSSSGREALTRIVTPWGIAVGRGMGRLAARSSPADSSVLAICLDGLVGLQETLKSPGELVVEKGQSTRIFKRAGVFERGEPDAAEVAALVAQSANMAHYQFSEVVYPKIGYLPKAITGLGFMVFFYGSAIGILNYVNHI